MFHAWSAIYGTATGGDYMILNMDVQKYSFLSLAETHRAFCVDDILQRQSAAFDNQVIGINERPAKFFGKHPAYADKDDI